jgi:hypothetical protein
MSVDIFSAFAVDEKAELEGRWVEYGDGVSFLVARSGNSKYNRLLSSQYKRNKVALEAKGAAAEALSDALMVEVMAKTILLDWKGELTLKGEKLEYNLENAKRVLAFKDFRRYISSLSEDFESFKAEQEEDEAKN